MKIIGIGVCGPGEANRYMRKTMEEFKRLCDEVLIVTCNATDAEIALLDEYNFKHYEDNKEWGKEQHTIKTKLLEKAGELQPDWIIALDMDETFAPEFTRQEAVRLGSGKEIAWHFLVVNLYNDDQHFAHNTGIQRFWNIRFYKYVPELGLQFLKKPLHCGLGPPYAYKFGWHAPYYLLHYGLMKPEDRAKRVERYNKYDPKGIHKSHVYYDDLKRELRMIPFDKEGLLRKLQEAKECQPRKTPLIK